MLSESYMNKGKLPLTLPAFSYLITVVADQAA